MEYSSTIKESYKGVSVNTKYRNTSVYANIISFSACNTKSVYLQINGIFRRFIDVIMIGYYALKH